MDVFHHCPGVVHRPCKRNCGCSEIVPTTCLPVGEQMPDLIRTWRAYSQHHSWKAGDSFFSVNVLDSTYQWFTETQLGFLAVPPHIRNLLEPFKLFYNVKSLVIYGTVDSEYKRSVISSAKQPEQTAAEIITSASVIKERGDEAFLKEQFGLSLSLYTSAIREFHVDWKRADYTGVIRIGEFANISTPHAVRLFKFRLHANLAASLVKVGEYPRAILHAKASVNQVNSEYLPAQEMGLYIPAGEIAAPFFWGGLAYEGFGDLNRAICGVGNAVFYSGLPHYPTEVDEMIVKREERFEPYIKKQGCYTSAENAVSEYERLQAEIERQGVVLKYYKHGKGTRCGED